MEYWRVLVKFRKLILVIISSAIVLSTVISFLLPKVYLAKASIMPPQQENSIAAGLVSNLTGGLGNIAGDFLGMESPADIWVGVLNSNTVKDAIIDRFDLRKIYKEDTIEETRAKLDKHVSVAKSKEQIISITVEDRDPERAAMMANAFVGVLDEVNKKVSMSNGRKTRLFVEQRLEKAKAELADVENRIRKFQESNKAVRLDEQSKVIMDAIGTLKGQLMAKEVELETLLTYAQPSHPQAQLLKSQVRELSAKLMEFETDSRGAFGKDIFIPTARMPALSIQYARLLRDAKVQETLYEFLVQQYEMSRLQEAKDSSTIQVLDIAKTPEKKSKPKKALLIIGAAAAAAFLSVILAFVLEYRANILQKRLGAE
ncbi:MAG: hypothetical protein IT362_11660 [Deltaproteobacteria bacterium]|nr:hypothetical protein [Deltaproteobacteria bacterium]